MFIKIAIGICALHILGAVWLAWIASTHNDPTLLISAITLAVVFGAFMGILFPTRR